MMKKLLLIVLATCFLLSFYSCSTTEDNFHYDLIAKYQYDENTKYYQDVVDDVEIADYGAKYNVPVYDVEPTSDKYLTYLYKYEGEKEFDLGVAQMNDYIKYLDAHFTKTADDGYFFSITDDSVIWVTYMNLKPMANGLLVAVRVPIATAGSDTAE